MTLRFDVEAFVRVALAELRNHLSSHPGLPTWREGEVLDFPPRMRSGSDLERLRRGLAVIAYGLVMRRFPGIDIDDLPPEAALLAIDAADHAMRAAIREVGYGEASGLQRLNARVIMREIERGLREGASPEEVADRAGVSRRTYFRYRRRLDC